MLIKKFNIQGLHGYKNVSIEFDNKAKIIVSENGSGKTTILSALNALLTMRFKRLGSIDFSSMGVVFSDDSEIEIKKNQLNESSGSGEELADRLGSESGLKADEIIKFVRGEYKGREQISMRASSTLRRIHLNSPHPAESVFEQLDSIRDAIQFDDQALGDVKERIRQNLQGVEVLFLPTYRRVELPLLRPLRRQSVGRFSNRSKGGFGGPWDARFRGMNFGLSDVEERLGELADEVERRSNSEYRLVSARMVNQLLQRQITSTEAEQFALPEMDALEMFFSRVERGAEIANAEALRKFYEDRDSGSEQRMFLRYFLGQLSQVIDQTRAIEEMLREFVDACNQYLEMSSEEKTLTYVPEAMKVEVRNTWTGSEVALDALSSGEKQVISLMAKLYLEPSRKLILIDEPELSLSLDWQRRILLDVQKPDSVEQFLAITHSPFVFDNELAKFAGPLSIERKRVLTS